MEPKGKKQKHHHRQLTIATLNTKGMNIQKVNNIEKLVREEKISILCIQETHKRGDRFIQEMERKLNVKAFIAEGSERARGVMTLINNDSGIVVKKTGTQRR